MCEQRHVPRSPNPIWCSLSDSKRREGTDLCRVLVSKVLKYDNILKIVQIRYFEQKKYAKDLEDHQTRSRVSSGKQERPPARTRPLSLSFAKGIRSNCKKKNGVGCTIQSVGPSPFHPPADAVALRYVPIWRKDIGSNQTSHCFAQFTVVIPDPTHDLHISII